jgi:hypothetical protein
MVQDYKDRALVRQADARTTRILRKLPSSIRKRLSSNRKPKSYTKKEVRQIARILEKTFPDTKNLKKLQAVTGGGSVVDNLQEVLESLDIKQITGTALRRLPAIAGLAVALTPSPAGDPDELKKLKKLESAGFKPTEAGRKRAVPGASKKKGGGKIKKNYSKGGGVRPASY